MKRLSMLIAVLAGMLMLTAVASADGTETLGTPSIPIADGTGFVAAGTGLITQPGIIDIEIPAGASVEQVLLYWEGQTKSGAPHDDDVTVNGVAVTGTSIGGPTTFFSSITSQTFRADITNLKVVGPGPNSVTIAGLENNFANNGAGILAVIDDGSGAEIELRDGNDLAFINFAPPLDTTVPQTYNLTPAAVDRTAELSMFFSSVSGTISGADADRPNSIEVTVTDGVTSTTTVISNALASVDEEEWDTLVVDVEIPAGADSLTVQAFSRDDNGSGNLPASFAWNASALSVPSVVNAVIDIEKFTKVGPQDVGGDSCDTLGKPVVLTLVYTGDGPDASSHSQDSGKASVTGDPNDEPNVRIIALDKSDPNDSKAKIWFDGVVALGDAFDIDAANEGKDRLSSNTYVLVFDTNDVLLQEVQFHTSCSQPLDLGNQFGSVKLTEWVGENGSAALPPVSPPSDFGEDADTPTGPIAQLGDQITWTYLVTNPGDTQLADVVVVDDNGTPGDTGDDFNPDPVLDGGFNVGDTDADNRLDPGEVWLYTASGVAQAGQYGNLSDVVGTPVDENGTTVGDDVTDEDPSHYFAEVPVIDSCDNGKPAVLTMVYTGDGPDATSHSQDSSKVSVTGDPNDEAVVRIVAASKDNLGDSKTKIWFDGVIALGGSFDIDAAAEGKDRLNSNTFVLVFDTNDNLLQEIEFHTSCSQPLFIGDQFGSVELVNFVPEA